MPRIREDAETEAPEASESNDGTEGKVKRARRPAPEGVVTGIAANTKPVDPPVRTGRRGRTVSVSTVQAIELLKANPGQWFEIGVYMSATPPSKESALGQHGFKFSHVRNDNGTFTRSAMFPGNDVEDSAA